MLFPGSCGVAGEPEFGEARKSEFLARLYVHFIVVGSLKFWSEQRPNVFTRTTYNATQPSILLTQLANVMGGNSQNPEFQLESFYRLTVWLWWTRYNVITPRIREIPPVLLPGLAQLRFSVYTIRMHYGTQGFRIIRPRCWDEKLKNQPKLA